MFLKVLTNFSGLLQNISDYQIIKKTSSNHMIHNKRVVDGFEWNNYFNGKYLLKKNHGFLIKNNKT